MAKIKFNKQEILSIALNVRHFGKLFVTSEGVMFHSQADAENAVRTRNMNIIDPQDYVGVVEITAEKVDNKALKAFADGSAAFEDLFKDMVIPRQRRQERPKLRKNDSENADDPAKIAELEALLGLNEQPASEEKKPASESKSKTEAKAKTDGTIEVTATTEGVGKTEQE